MSFQNGAQVGLNFQVLRGRAHSVGDQKSISVRHRPYFDTSSISCVESSDFTWAQFKLVPWCVHLNKDKRTRTNRQSLFIHFCSYIRISNHVALYQNLDSILIRSLYTNITFKLFPKLENNSFFTKFLN